MTLLPSQSWDVEPVEGERYQLPERCQAPGCKRYPDHSHHLWRRSFLVGRKRQPGFSGGDFWWVRVPTGEVVKNVIGLCLHHHEDVTENRAWIKWLEGSEFAWHELRSTDNKWQQTGALSLPAPAETPLSGHASEGREAERCPTCGKLKTRAHVEHEPGPKRPRKSWTIKVPDDTEDGAAVLDELVEGCAMILGREEYTSQLKRYYIVVEALAFLLQNSSLVEVA